EVGLDGVVGGGGGAGERVRVGVCAVVVVHDVFFGTGAGVHDENLFLGCPGGVRRDAVLERGGEDGISPYSTWTSKKKIFIVHTSAGPEKYVVHNDDGAYTDSNTLTRSTTTSHNAIQPHL